MYIETSGVCNLSCIFCAYPKKEVSKVTMSMETFQGVVNQATNLGFSDISLTPLTGEVFMDKEFIKKMEYLDTHPKIARYYFSTNFVIPSEQQIEKLFELKKLKIVHISVYGHDEISFCNLTQHSIKQYKRLVKNLNYLSKLYRKERKFKLFMSWRTTSKFLANQAPINELQQVVRDIGNRYQIEISNTPLYDNWGGIITADEVKDSGIRVKSTAFVYQKGLCTLILDRIIVLADGRVNACACRDVNGSLIIGDIKKNPLKEILSLENPSYKKIIQEQMRNQFGDVCKGCSFYRSIYTPVQKPFSQYYNLAQIQKLLSNEDNNF